MLVMARFTVGERLLLPVISVSLLVGYSCPCAKVLSVAGLWDVSRLFPVSLLGNLQQHLLLTRFTVGQSMGYTGARNLSE